MVSAGLVRPLDSNNAAFQESVQNARSQRSNTMQADGNNQADQLHLVVDDVV